MTYLMAAAFVGFAVVCLTRVWKLRRTPEAWQTWAACVLAVVGVASVLFDKDIDAWLGGTNWVFMVETWSAYFAYALMTETCRAVGQGGNVTARAWVLGLVLGWCGALTGLFISLQHRDGTLSHFVRAMFDQPPALMIGIMYSLGLIVLGSLPIFWLRKEGGAAAWLIRAGCALTLVAHGARLIVTPIDFVNTGPATPVEMFLYDVFVPTNYPGLACFAAGLVAFSLRRLNRDRQRRMHTRRLGRIADVHRIDTSRLGDAITGPVAMFISVEDAVRSGDVVLSADEKATLDSARDWLARTHSDSASPTRKAGTIR